VNFENPNQATIEKLQAVFQTPHVYIQDNSAAHAGHVAMQGAAKTSGTHLDVMIVAELFEGQPVVMRQRAVQKALAEEFANGLHALQIKPLTPSEYTKRLAEAGKA
jgi:BolA family transcriptional regulator, general stress-responsive regulator